jgi:hypothetical protein
MAHFGTQGWGLFRYRSRWTLEGSVGGIICWPYEIAFATPCRRVFDTGTTTHAASRKLNKTALRLVLLRASIDTSSMFPSFASPIRCHWRGGGGSLGWLGRVESRQRCEMDWEHGKQEPIFGAHKVFAKASAYVQYVFDQICDCHKCYAKLKTSGRLIKFGFFFSQA